MNEHPILFTGPEVRAILDGRKTMTRRVVKPKSRAGHIVNLTNDGYPLELVHHVGTRLVPCPLGKPGHKLWVRETFVIAYDVGDGKNLSVIPWSGSDPQRDGKVIYRADGKHDDESKGKMPWRRSIHMPRWASRITLEITDVRVERLHQITGKDIIKEGAVLRSHDDQFGHNPVSSFDEKVYLDLISLWANGWEKINGKGSWRANPWVWVIEFKMVDTAPIGGKA